MKIVIEFYRTRDADDAHAVVARETTEAADLNEAIEIAGTFRGTSTCRSNLTR